MSECNVYQYIDHALQCAVQPTVTYSEFVPFSSTMMNEVCSFDTGRAGWSDALR